MAEQDPRRDLPAPYASPWGLLAEDLRAVAASVRLRLWEIWRRNRQGLLPVPDRWPRDLTAWFWPLLLALLLAGLAGMALLIAEALQPVSAPPLPTPEGSIAAQEPELHPMPRPEPKVASEPELAAQPEPETQLKAEAQLEPEPAPGPDTLLSSLQDGVPAGLLAAVQQRSQEAQLMLVLVLQPGWWQQTPELRQRWAQRWQQQALELGYERLALEDGEGRSLGRPALVGSGMILLTPPALPDADRA